MLETEKRIYRLYRIETGKDGKASVAKYVKDVCAVITMTSDRRDIDNTVGAMLIKKRYVGVATDTSIKDGDVLKLKNDKTIYRIISTEKRGNERYLHLETLSVFPSEAFDFEVEA